MIYTLSNSYVLKWEYMDNPDYKFTKEGVCVNTKTGREIRKVLNGRSIGFCLPKFKSLNSIRKKLRKVTVDDCPF